MRILFLNSPSTCACSYDLMRKSRRNKGYTNDKTELKIYHKTISVENIPRRLIARIKK